MNFPWLAAGLGLIAALVLAAGGGLSPDPHGPLPLLTRLFIAEFGLLLSLAGIVVGVRRWRDPKRPPGLPLATLTCGLLFLGWFVVGLLLLASSGILRV